MSFSPAACVLEEGLWARIQEVAWTKSEEFLRIIKYSRGKHAWNSDKRLGWEVQPYLQEAPRCRGSRGPGLCDSTFLAFSFHVTTLNHQQM